MIIRKAMIDELSAIEKIYDRARSFMRDTGNGAQWGYVYPPTELICSDIENGNLFVVFSDEIEAVFAFFNEADPTYDYIEGE